MDAPLTAGDDREDNLAIDVDSATDSGNDDATPPALEATLPHSTELQCGQCNNIYKSINSLKRHVREVRLASLYCTAAVENNFLYIGARKRAQVSLRPVWHGVQAQ